MNKYNKAALHVFQEGFQEVVKSLKMKYSVMNIIFQDLQNDMLLKFTKFDGRI